MRSVEVLILDGQARVGAHGSVTKSDSIRDLLPEMGEVGNGEQQQPGRNKKRSVQQ